MTQTETRADAEAIRPLRLHDRGGQSNDRLRTIAGLLAEALDESIRESEKAIAMRDDCAYLTATVALISLRSTVSACVTLLQRECGL